MRITNFAHKERILSVSYLLMFVPYVVTILSHVFLDNVRRAAESWQVTEILINYQGGFVRRGLVGEIIYWLHCNCGIDVMFQVYTFSILSVLIFFYLVIRDTIRRGYSVLMLPTAMLLSSLFVSGYWVRKDFFIILLFYTVVRLLKTTGCLKYILINFLLIVGVLSHEVIIFISLPILYVSMLYDCKANDKYNKNVVVWAFVRSMLCYLPTLVVSVLVLMNKGDAMVAARIWQSWHSLGVVNGDIATAIDAIGWTLARAIETGVAVWSHVSCGVYYPFMWAILSLIAFVIFVWMYKLKPRLCGYAPFNDFPITESIYIILFQFLAMVPLLLVFADTSRAFFYVIMSSYIIRLYDERKVYVKIFGCLPQKIAKCTLSIDRYIATHPRSFVALAFVIGLPTINVSALEHVILHGQLGFFFKSIIDIIR